MTAFMGSAINIALPIIGKEFGSSAVTLSWLATAYILTAAVLLIPVGKLTDIYGRARFLLLGVTIFSAGTLVCGLSASDTMLLVFRLLQGIGASMIFTTSTALLVSVYPLNERGKVIGINTTAVYVGLSSGPFLGGLISHYIGWRFIFFITFILGACIVILILTKLKEEWSEARDESFDFSGSAVYVASLTLVMLGLTFLPAISGIVLFSSGIIVLIYFFKLEEKKANPVFDVNLFRTSRTFMFSNLAALLNYSATFALGFLMSLYMQSVKGLSSQEAGFVLVAQPVMMALFSPLAGKISDRIEPQIVSSFGMAILTAGLSVFVFLNGGFELVWIILNLAFLGFGFALFSSPNANAIMSSVDKKYYGVASSTLASMRMVGQMFSMGIVIVLFSLFIGDAKISQANQTDFVNSIRTAFIVFSVLSFIGIFTSLSRGKIHNH